MSPLIPLRFEGLFAKRLSRIKPGLARVQQANEQLGWISRRTPSILIAGTNGKGTASAFLWRLLGHSGLRCGLFTSPHLVSFAERIQISDQQITERDLGAAIPQLVAQMDPELWEELSFFEASLLLAFLVWRDRQTDLNVLEVGLGGRLDATNIANPEACIITSIGIDHTEYLGGSIREIAFEKAGIMRPGRPVFVGFSARDRDSEKAHQVIAANAASLGAKLYVAGRDFGVEGGQFYFKPEAGIQLTAELPVFFDGAAPYLVENFAVAAAAAFWFFWIRGRRSGVPWGSANEVAQAFDRFSKPEGPWAPVLCGRFHQLNSTFLDGFKGSPQNFLFDVCHNPHGAKRFVEALDQKFGTGSKLPGIVSILRDKDIGGILDVLSRKLDPIVLFKIANDRGLNRDTIPNRYRELPLAEDFAAAGAIMMELRAAKKLVSHFPWVVCGSVMAVGEVLGRIEIPNAGAHTETIREMAMATALRRCLAMRDHDDRDFKPGSRRSQR